MGIFDGILGRSPLKLERTAEGPRLTETRTGLSWVAPADGDLVQGFAESPVSPAFDAAFRLKTQPVEVRLRLETVSLAPGLPPPAPGSAPPAIPVASPQLAHDLCAHYADMRTEGEPLVGVAQPWQLAQWRIEGAASTIYPLARPEGAFDMEETHVLVKETAKGAPPRAIVFMKLFSTKKVTPALWSDLNGRMNATLAWGGEPRVARPPVVSYYVDASMELMPEAREGVKRLAATLREAKVEAARTAEAAANVQRFAYGSDPPDAPLDGEVRELLVPALLEPLGASVLRDALDRELKERVKTYRDFRGLHVFLDAVSRELA
jgi:hypothetical protein